MRWIGIDAKPTAQIGRRSALRFACACCCCRAELFPRRACTASRHRSQMNLVQACIHPAHGSRAGRGWKFPPATAICCFARIEDNSPRAVQAGGSAGCFSPLIMLNMSIIGEWEVAMPILQAFGPSAGRAPLPPPIAGATAAARRYGVLPVPSLEWNAQVERETAQLYDAGKDGHSAGRVAVLRALRQGDQRAQAGAQRRHPGAQLPDAGNLQLRRRFRRRLAPACARGDQGRRRHHRAVRRAFHGRDLEDPQSRTRPC